MTKSAPGKPSNSAAPTPSTSGSSPTPRAPKWSLSPTPGPTSASRVSTVCLPSLHPAIDAPWLEAAATDQTQALADAYTHQFETAEPPATPLAPQGWTEFRDAIAAHLGAAVRDDVEAVTDEIPQVGTPNDTVSLAGVLTLVAAHHDCLQRDLRTVGVATDVASPGTCTNIAQEFEAADYITRENEPTGDRGRPPKRLHLDVAADSPAALAEILDAVLA